MKNQDLTPTTPTTKENDAVKLFTAFKEAVNKEYKGAINLLEEHSSNSFEIDRLKTSNEDILTKITSTFQEKLKEYKKDLTKKEAISASFNVLDMSILASEQTHKSTEKIYKSFKSYYTSKLYIPTAVFNYSIMSDCLKISKYIPIKSINRAVDTALLETAKGNLVKLKVISGNIQTIFKAPLSEALFGEVETLTNKLFELKNSKFYYNKSQFGDTDTNVLQSIADSIKVASVLNDTPEFTALLKEKRLADKIEDAGKKYGKPSKITE